MGFLHFVAVAVLLFFGGGEGSQYLFLNFKNRITKFYLLLQEKEAAFVSN